MAEKKYSLAFKSSEIVHMGMQKSKRGYNYASVGIKRGKDHYMSINYEWEGDKLPDFIMDIMSYFNTEDTMEKASVEEHTQVKEEFNSFMQRLKETL